MSMELVRRARVLRLCKDILGDEARANDLEELIEAMEEQSSLIEGLLRQEAALMAETSPDSNLVPFMRKPLEGKSPSLKIWDKRFVIQTPCLIEGSTESERKKLAFEIHSRSQKSIFVDLEKTPGFLSTDLESLEGATVFVSSLEDYATNEQQVLIQSLEKSQCPLIIAGTRLSYSQLKNSDMICDELLNLVTQAHFRLQKPLSEYKELGFFKLFLESLS